jgi:hypothetical protein
VEEKSGTAVMGAAGVANSAPKNGVGAVEVVLTSTVFVPSAEGAPGEAMDCGLGNETGEKNETGETIGFLLIASGKIGWLIETRQETTPSGTDIQW